MLTRIERPGRKDLLAFSPDLKLVAEKDYAAQCVRVHDLISGESNELDHEGLAAWYSSAWLGDSRLAYLDDMISTAPEDRTGGVSAMQGWSREIRIFDAASGEVEVLWPGAR